MDYHVIFTNNALYTFFRLFQASDKTLSGCLMLFVNIFVICLLVVCLLLVVFCCWLYFVCLLVFLSSVIMDFVSCIYTGFHVCVCLP